MKTQWIRTATMLLLAGVMTVGMNAQPRKGLGYGSNQRTGGGAGFDENGPGRMAFCSQMDLTDAQQEQLKTLRLEHYKAIQPLRSKMIELKARERTLILEDNADMKALNSVIDEQSDLNNKISKLRVEHRVKVRSLLTDEQKMLMDQRRSSGVYGKGHGQGWGDGNACPRAPRHWRNGPGVRGNGPGPYGRGPAGWGAFPGSGDDQPAGEEL